MLFQEKGNQITNLISQTRQVNPGHKFLSNPLLASFTRNQLSAFFSHASPTAKATTAISINFPRMFTRFVEPRDYGY
jgi:hypothetical protein